MSKKTNKVTVSTVDLQFPLGRPFNQFFCPACGKAILEPNQAFEAPQCQHVEWVYLDEIGEFIFAQPPVQTQIDELNEKAEDDDDFDLFEELQNIWGSSTKVIFNVTTGGMACGPVWETARFGLNFVLDESDDDTD
jgi:hypothetical protein